MLPVNSNFNINGFQAKTLRTFNGLNRSNGLFQAKAEIMKLLLTQKAPGRLRATSRWGGLASWAARFAVPSSSRREHAHTCTSISAYPLFSLRFPINVLPQHESCVDLFTGPKLRLFEFDFNTTVLFRLNAELNLCMYMTKIVIKTVRKDGFSWTDRDDSEWQASAGHTYT
ncbi:hypothetical protein R3P38DRAFT_2757463 [Favolaschia claudopus]|uniref:Uncharacterized protein n=1 Tax=Favolaschia claudopus TaxID=2862362 RepID=A0AAW0EJV7_9AGAR